MLVHKLDRLSDYIRLLELDSLEVDALFQDMLINVTGFFRDAEVFEALRQETLPKLLDKRPSESPLHIWVAGCSSGEEAYSLAISLQECLGVSLQKKVLQIFHYALQPNGFLLLGTSETIAGHADLFRLLNKKNKIYTKKSVTLRGQYEFTPRTFFMKEARAADVAYPEAHPKLYDLHQAVEKAVLAKYGPPGVVINSDLEILHFRGETGPYLNPVPGSASLNLLKMARQALAVEMRSAGAKEEYLAATETEADRNRVHELEQELVTSREYMQSIIEEQEATNEELETAKEELQSTNEELSTVNEELENRNIDLGFANNDLTNLLASVNLPILMLGEDLSIRQFTPQAEKRLNLIESDISERIRQAQQSQRLATIVLDANDAITMRDFDSAILAWKPAAERLYSWSETEALSMNVFDMVPKAEHSAMLGIIRQVQGGENPLANRDVANYQSRRDLAGTLEDLSTGGQAGRSQGHRHD